MFAKRLFLLISTLVIAFGAAAATVEDRSPFRQGHWWDPTRSGHGFEVLSNAGQVMVVWYTYDDRGLPIWYTAQGTQESMGTAWTLQKHRWGDGRIVESTDVGIMRLKVDHFEKMTSAWQIGHTHGTWTIVPFVESGVINEVDLTGHWYNPATSGWGMTLLDQGDVFGAVIYAYDPAGEPTWVAGFDRGKGTRINLHWTRGTCPSCPYRTIDSRSAGFIDIGYRGDTEVTVHGVPDLPLAADLRIDGARVFQLGRPASTRRVDYQLAAFAGKDTLKAYLAAGMEGRTFGWSSPAGSDFSAAPPSGSPSFSTTNTQEVGVDEADVMKSDGRRIFSLTSAVTSGFTQKVRVIDVGPDASLLQPLGEFDLFRSTTSRYVQASLYLHADNLVTLASLYYFGGWFASAPASAETHVQILDVADPRHPSPRWSAILSGAVVSSRRIGDRVFLVTRFSPHVPGYIAFPRTEEQRQANAAALAAAPVESLLPHISINGGPPTPLLAPDAVYAPQPGGRAAVADLIVVAVIDIREARVVDGMAIAGRTDTLYVSSSNIYVASSRYNFSTATLTDPAPTSLHNTDIHQIAIGADRLQFVGSGSIEGRIGFNEKAAFRFGEHAGTLGVLSSLQTWSNWGGGDAVGADHRLTILQPSATSPGLLKTVSYLPNSARPKAIGKPGEDLYGTRFVGDKLYAVTYFRPTGVDPLYTIDLSDKNDPKITGEFDLPGFSDYLHPLPNGLLLGLGQDATGQGRIEGLQVTLFDVSGPAPVQVDQVVIGKGGSDSALFGSHHAFSALARADGSTYFAFPGTVHDEAGTSGWAPWQYSGLLRFEVRGATPATARLVSLPPLVVASRADTVGWGGYDESRWGWARSVLFQDTSVYLSRGKFWRQDAAGNTSGPY